VSEFDYCAPGKFRNQRTRRKLPTTFQNFLNLAKTGVKKKSRWMVSVPSGEEDRNRAIIAPSLVGVNSVHTEKKSRRRWLTGGKNRERSHAVWGSISATALAHN